MSTTQRMAAAIVVALSVVCATRAVAQPRFDTEITKSTETITCSGEPWNNLHHWLTNSSVPFDRSRGRFSVGLNWYGMQPPFTGFFGVNAIDNYVYTLDADGTGGNAAIKDYPDNARLILAGNDNGNTGTSDCRISADVPLLWGEGYTLMTRVDPEISVTGGEPVIEPTGNTGAVHGFDSTGGTVNGSHVELRGTAAITFSDNTNKRIWRSAHTSAVTMVHADTTYPDPMRTGEMMVVGISLRRVGPVSSEGEVLDEPVVKVRVLRQKRKLIENGTVVPDPRGLRFLKFSFIPRTDGIGGTFYQQRQPLQIGVDDLPNLFADLALVPTDAEEIDSKFVGTAYTKMPLAIDADVPQGLAGREYVWQYMKDVRGAAGDDFNTPDIREEIVITRRMLKELVDHPTTTVGTPENDRDGESYWTLFEGLIVFGKAANVVEDELFSYNFNGTSGTTGFSSKVPNLRFVKDGRRGHPDGAYSPQNPGEITDLEVEVMYMGGVDVDFDYVVLQTPNARALLRDQYRSRVSRQIAAAVKTLNAVVTAQNLSGKNFSILGIRSHEEEGELSWYGQRYLNILTNGLMISEQNNKPYDRYRHIAYPFTASTGTYPTHPLPLWVWNEGSTGRMDPLTPVPFLQYGAQQSSGFYTYGYARGVCGNQWFSGGTGESVNGETFQSRDGGPCSTSIETNTSENVMRRALLTHDHALGEPCVGEPFGGPNGQFAYFKDASDMRLWWYPQWLEAEDTDTDPANDAATHPGCTTLNKALALTLQARPSTLKLTTSLYAEFLAPGNDRFLFSGAPWLEQVWLGTDKWCVRQTYTGGGSTKAAALVSRGDQARPMTGEETRTRLMLPTLLGTSGLMLFVGNHFDELGSFTSSAPTTPPVASASIQRAGFASILTMRATLDAQSGTVSEQTMRERMATSLYGPDYPTANPGGRIELNAEIKVRKKLWVPVEADGYVDDGMALSSTTADKLWYSTFGYRTGAGEDRSIQPPTSITSIDLGGTDIVQRFNDDGTKKTTVGDVERVYVGHHSTRLEVMRYASWLKGSWLSGGVSRYDDAYAGARGPNDVDASGAVNFTSPATVADLLGSLDLHAWHARSLKTFDRWRAYPSGSNPLLSWVDVSRVRARHPVRQVNARADYEHADSVLVDITLLKRRRSPEAVPYAADAYLDEVYIGVANRRENPLVMIDPDAGTAHDDQPRFISTREFMAAAARPGSGIGIHSQLGARSVLLPFNASKTAPFRLASSTTVQTLPMLLHVSEVAVGTGADQRDDVLYTYTQGSTSHVLKRRLIDTIIDPRTALEVDLLPGEGKLLRVRPIPAISTDDIVGNLAYSTQTKLVVAPEQVIDAQTQLATQTEKLRYHMVYTREVPNVGLRVFYRRSLPYHRDALPSVAGLRWEATETVLGDQFTVLPEGPVPMRATLWQAGPPAFGNYPVQQPPVEVTVEARDQAPAVQINAAYPSITIARAVHVNEQNVTRVDQRIHIVYSAVVNRPQGAPVGEQHVVETVLRDGGAAPVVAASRSLSVIAQQALAGFNNGVLRSWGTPTNGISSPATPTAAPPYEHSDRVFTAWSVRPGTGITCGVRQAYVMGGAAEEGYFDAIGQDVDVIGITQVEDAGGEDALAQYPSLTPTATAVGGSTPAASLVWQEHAMDDATEEDRFNGWAIMYARVWEDRTPMPAFGRHDFGVCDQRIPMQYAVGTPPPMQVIAAAANAAQIPPVMHGYVMRVSTPADGAVSQYPTITRSGSRGATVPAMVMDVHGDPAPLTYQTEALTFQTVPSGGTHAVIHRRHFIHGDNPSPNVTPGDVMRYWFMGSTTSAGANVIAPTITNGAYRYAQQTYTPPPATPVLPTVTITGNVSDTAFVSAFGLIGGDLLQQGGGLDPSGTLDLTAWDLPRAVWQCYLRPVPIPVHAGGFTATGDGFGGGTDRQSAAGGIWPHLSHRMSGVEQAKQVIRRVQQESGATTQTPIRVLADGLYKDAGIATWRVKGGYHDGENFVSIGGLSVDGDELELRREGVPSMGVVELAESALRPLPDLLSQAFDVKDIKDIALDVDGTLREGTVLSLEEVDTSDVTARGRSVLLELPPPAGATSRKRVLQRLLLVGDGRKATYRLRLSAPARAVVMEDVLIDDDRAEFARAGAESVVTTTVQLASMRAARGVMTSQIHLIPNPAHDVLTIIPILATSSTRATVEIVDAVGSVVEHVPIGTSERCRLDVSGYPAGVYAVRVTAADGTTSTATCVITH